MAISFEEWKRKKEGAPSGAPKEGMDLPSDTVPTTRPRLTFQEWKASKLQAPTVEPATVEAAAQAPTPSAPVEPPTPTDPSKLQIGGQGYFGVGADIMATQAAAAGMGMTPEAREATKGFVKEEGLPIVAGTAATMALPVTATAGLSGWALSAVVAGGGSTAGEFIEQSLKKIGLMDAPPGEKPETWGDVGKASIIQGGEDAAFTAGTDALVRLVPQALRLPFTVGSRLTEDNKHMVKVLREKGGPVLASDVAEGLFINYSNSAATYSFTKAGRIMGEAREVQEEILGKAAQEPLEKLVELTKAGVVDEYMDASFKVLPDEVSAQFLTSTLRDGERAAKDVGSSMYAAIDEAAKEIGTKMIKQVDEVDSGLVDLNGAPIISQRVTEVEAPLFTVKIKGARKVLEDEIKEAAKDLKPEAAADYTKFAKSQLRLFSLTDEISFTGATRQIKTMSADARALARSSEEGAATKRMFLLKSIDSLQGAMDRAAGEMADAGVTVGGRNFMEFKREADKLWRGLNEDFGNKYVQQMLDKADELEGAAGTLAHSFMQNREASEAIMNALEASEKAGIKAGNFGMMDSVSKTRAAVGAKVYENMLERVLISDDIKGAMLMLNRPDSRKALLRLLGDENLSLLDTSVRSLVEAKRRGLNVGAFTQFARESAALMEGVPTTSDTFKRFVSTLSMPRLLSKGLRDKRIVESLQGVHQETNLNRQVFMYNQILHDAIPYAWEEWNSLSPEEQQKLEYRNRLATM